MEYPRDLGNKFNSFASKISFMDHYLRTTDMVAGWTSDCNSQKWDSRSTPQYESKCWGWICATFPGRFKSFRECSAATSSMTTMK
eukprot:3040950-Pyramimonas_sp.AAC.1